jgi:hypothetical protein
MILKLQTGKIKKKEGVIVTDSGVILFTDRGDILEAIEGEHE